MTEAERKRALELLIDVKTLLESDGLYETEYDGRMYELCLYCDYQSDCRPQHSEGCAVGKANAAYAELRKLLEAT